MQLYMGWSGMDRAFYLAVCKDTDELYSERVEFSRAEFDRLMQAARDEIFGEEDDLFGPKRLSDSPAHYYCKSFCPMARVCHGPAYPRVNCRTCINSTPDPDGTWKCERHEKTLALPDQEAGCPDHLYLPALMVQPFRDAERDWIAYEGEGGPVVNMIAGGRVPENLRPAFTSRELEKLTFDQVPAALAAKRDLGGTVADAP